MLHAIGMEGLLEAEGGEAPAELQRLAAQREAARSARDFAAADALRAELEGRGWLVKDTPAGTALERYD
jgi:cysteinyl-tRNA synthetase